MRKVKSDYANEITKRFRIRIIFLLVILFQMCILLMYIGRGEKRKDAPDFTCFSSAPKRVNFESPKLAVFENETKMIGDSPECGYLVRSPLLGRLGNQMFMYASFYGIVKKEWKSNKTPFLCNSPQNEYKMLLNDIFENLTIPERNLTSMWFDQRNFSRRQEKDDKCCIYDNIGIENLECDGENVIISGFRQSYKYFKDSMEEIRKEFTFKIEIREQCRIFYNNIFFMNGLNGKQCVSVGVHLRRGDFGKKNETEFGHTPVKLSYLKRAIRFYETFYFGTNLPQSSSPGLDNANCLVFLLFGDDYQWNLNVTSQIELIRPNNSHVIVIDTRKSGPSQDLCTLSLCDHVIISTGTFGWWTGFFSKGMVVYQKEYARFGSDHYFQYKKDDYFLPHWIGL